MNNNLVNNGNLWFPEAITEYAKDYDFFYYLIYYFSIFLFIGVVGVTLYFMYRFRKTDKNQQAEKQIIHNYALEFSWTIIPFFLVMILFAWGFKDYMKMSIIPNNTIEYTVTGQKWSWLFRYPEGIEKSGELLVPIGKPVKLTMISRDVIHSFFIPNFRIKRDVFPNQYTTLWFQAEKLGSYQIFCTEYCGDQHSTMLASIKVVTQKEYDEFIAKEKALNLNSLPLPEQGKRLVELYGCTVCHSIDGKVLAGPTWKGLFGKERTFENAEPVIADENYLRESIVEPGKKIVKGYSNAMSSFAYLSEKQIDAIIAYIKTLK